MRRHTARYASPALLAFLSTACGFDSGGGGSPVGVLTSEVKRSLKAG